MKYFKIMTLMLIAAMLVSCEKVIDIDLEQAESQIVIEAELKAGSNPFEVKISKSKPYFEENETEFVSNASVSLSDENGNVIELSHTQNGLYIADVIGVINVEYTLLVNVNGREYRAKSKVNEAVQLTGLEYEFQEGFGPLEEGYAVYFKFSDPPSTQNFYRVIHKINGEEQNSGSDFIVEDDRLFNGNNVRLSLARKAFELGDTIEVSLVHINEETYEYFSALQDILGGNGGPGASAAPGNPISNWSNNALGYFAAINTNTQTIVIQ